MDVVVNATQARRNFFDILAAAKNKKQVTKIKLDGVVVAKIVPEETEKFDWDEYERKMKKKMKILRKSNWGDVLEFRKKADIRRYRGW